MNTIPFTCFHDCPAIIKTGTVHFFKDFYGRERNACTVHFFKDFYGRERKPLVGGGTLAEKTLFFKMADSNS
jgi:hypothetical protein